MTEHEEDLHDPRLTALYRRRDGEQPPARLDAEVRKAAHAAVRRPVSRRLWPSLATAAVLVLGVSVAFRVFERPELEQAGSDPGFDRSMPVQPRTAAPVVEEQRARREAVAPLESKSSRAPPAASPATPPGLSIQGRVAPAPAEAEEDLRADARERVENGRARVWPSVADETLPAVDCDAYGNLSEQSEAELQERLASYRQIGDRAAIQCLSQALDQVRERVRRVGPAAQ